MRSKEAFAGKFDCGDLQISAQALLQWAEFNDGSLKDINDELMRFLRFSGGDLRENIVRPAKRSLRGLAGWKGLKVAWACAGMEQDHCKSN